MLRPALQVESARQVGRLNFLPGFWEWETASGKCFVLGQDVNKWPALSYLVLPEFGQGQKAGQWSGSETRREGTSKSHRPPRAGEAGGHGFMQQLLSLPVGLLQGPSLPACVLPCGGGGAGETQVRVAGAGGREPAGAPRSGGNGMWARHGSGRGLGAWVGIKNMGGAGSGRGVGVGAARVGTEDLGGAPGQRPARQSLDRRRQAGLPIPPWGSLHLAQGSSESWSPGTCLWGLPSLDSRSFVFTRTEALSGIGMTVTL